MVSNGECLVCGKTIKYLKVKKSMNCVFCGKSFLSNASCEDDHYVCDSCHGEKGIETIMDYLKSSKSRNPIEMMIAMMKDPYIYMHGPEHHIMVGAALMTAFYNADGDIDLDKALEEMKSRGSEYPGGSCGFWGCCGAAASVGMFMSIITESTPLSGKSWGQINLATSKALEEIGNLGGPRCCKRNSFTATIAAAKFVEENYGIKMEVPQSISCEFYENNKQCIRKACPYYKIER